MYLTYNNSDVCIFEDIYFRMIYVSIFISIMLDHISELCPLDIFVYNNVYNDNVYHINKFLLDKNTYIYLVEI